MTLLQLIAHLKDIYGEHGNLDVKLGLISYPGELILSDIQVDPEAKTITFT